MEAMNPLTLNDTVAMMLSDDYKERFKAEYYQLEYRRNKLATMLLDLEAGNLDFEPTCPRSLLCEQLRLMQMYSSTLRERAEIEGIEL
jgi:hypothetical protein